MMALKSLLVERVCASDDQGLQLIGGARQSVDEERNRAKWEDEGEMWWPLAALIHIHSSYIANFRDSIQACVS